MVAAVDVDIATVTNLDAPKVTTFQDADANAREVHVIPSGLVAAVIPDATATKLLLP